MESSGRPSSSWLPVSSTPVNFGLAESLDRLLRLEILGGRRQPV
jgi:hypothetical protein